MKFQHDFALKPRALRLLLISVLLSVQVATVAGVVLGVQRVHKDKYTADSYARVQQMANVFVDQTRRFLQPVRSNLAETRRLIATGQLDADDSLAIERQLLSQLRMSSSIRSLIVAHADGSFVSARRRGGSVQTSSGSAFDTQSLVTSTRYSNAGRPQHRSLDEHSGYDPRTRPWYEVAMRSDTIQWTRPYAFYRSDVPGLSAATRLYAADGSPAGVLAIHIGIRELSEFLSVIPNAVGASAALVIDDFDTIAYSEPNASLMDAKGGVIPLQALADRPLLALQSNLSSTDGTLDQGAQGFIRFSSDTREYLGFTRRLSIADGQMNWTLMVQAPATVYSGALKADIKRSLWWLLGVIVISSVIAVAAILQLTAPVFDLHRLATRDRLTGALSRAEFERRLRSLLNLDRRGPKLRTVLVALDLDGFKQVNDQFGHAAGDLVLIEFVRRLRDRLRRGDLVARLGGDEFMVAVQLHDVAEYMSMIERIRHSLVNQPIVTAHARHTIGVTAGVAVLQDDDSIETLLERADQALVAGKSVAKNRSYEASTTSSHAANDEGAVTVDRTDAAGGAAAESRSDSSDHAAA